jgi:sugar phosphate isomerase/epimerase
MSRIGDLRKHGLAAIELGAGVKVGNDLDRLFSEDGVQCFIHNYFPPPASSFVLNLASADESVRNRSADLVRAALELSARLGAPFYSVHGGFITDPVGFDGIGFVFPAPASKDEARHAMERFVDTLRGLLKNAAACGVKILIENNVCVQAAVGKLLLQESDGFAELFAALPDPNLGMLLDTGHLNVSARTLGFDRGLFVDRVQPYVRAFHVHDNDGTADTHDVVAQGSWVLDVLRRPGFRGVPLVIESKFADASGLARHVEWLEMELEH